MSENDDRGMNTIRSLPSGYVYNHTTFAEHEQHRREWEWEEQMQRVTRHFLAEAPPHAIARGGSQAADKIVGPKRTGRFKWARIVRTIFRKRPTSL